MAGYIVRRLLAMIPVMGIVAVFVSGLLFFSPGDPAAIIAGDVATPEQVEEVRVALGLDRPFVEQFVYWLGRVLQGDLGRSIFSNLPVTQLIVQRLEPTIALTCVTVIAAVIIAVPLGTLAAWRAGSLLDQAVMAFSVVGFSLPGFVLAYGLVYLFAVKLGVFPVQGYAPLSSGLGPFLQSIALPSLALGINFIAFLARITRATMIDVLNEDYIRTATAKGLALPAVLLHHALKNAAVPIVTVIGIGVASLMGGVVITETVFSIPGIGRLTVDAVLHRDYPVIQGVILLFSFAYVIINLIVDLIYTLVDPRIRY